MPDTVPRPPTAPVPLSPAPLARRTGSGHPGLIALRTAAGELAEQEGRLVRTPGSLFPTTAPGRAYGNS
ncbi:hypothetical protein [Streptomyces sp. NRRL F-5135]|uniref:hypothetical protein n=1 Tax=Streptomyces sp. NRRL F-5135 TaxID=1463858 RepID=UPI00131ECB3A|nr:hypothetical protein [Streptomyces sp. NRRL F-5135]